jgi:IS605 OrfB family transposase
VLRKTAKFIGTLAVESRAVVVVGSINEKAKEEMERDASNKLRHRIHQLSYLMRSPYTSSKSLRGGLHLETHSRVEE